MSQLDDLGGLEQVPVLVRNPKLHPVSQSLADDFLVTDARLLVADVVSVATLQTLNELLQAPVTSPESLLGTLRLRLIEMIRVERHGWGSWEALLVVPPDAVVLALNELAVPIGAAIAVRLGELSLNRVGARVLGRLRNGNVDPYLIEHSTRARRFDFELWFPGGVVLRIRKSTSQSMDRSRDSTRSKEQSRTAASPRTHSRKGRKPRRKG
jgi:hypothetical protein